MIRVSILLTLLILATILVTLVVSDKVNDDVSIEEYNELMVEYVSIESRLNTANGMNKMLTKTCERFATEINQLKKLYNTVEDYNKSLINMYKMVEAEATGGSYQSKLNVAHVIMNRVRSDQFPDTIDEVLFQKRQFSPLSDGRFNTVIVTDSTIEAVNEAILSKDTTNGALFFMLRSKSDSKNVTWFDENLEYLFTDDLGHSFFK